MSRLRKSSLCCFSGASARDTDEVISPTPSQLPKHWTHRVGPSTAAATDGALPQPTTTPDAAARALHTGSGGKLLHHCSPTWATLSASPWSDAAPAVQSSEQQLRHSVCGSNPGAAPQQQGGNSGDGAGNPVPAANDSSMAASHPSGDHWNPFSPSSELPPGSGTTPAGSGEPGSPVAMGGPGSSLITAPAGSPDPFMPPPPVPAHEGPQTQPVPRHDAAAQSAAARALTATGSHSLGSAANRIQTPEQLRQRFAERANAGDSTVNPPRIAAEGAHPARLGRQRSASRVIPGTAAAAGLSFRRRLQHSFSAVR